MSLRQIDRVAWLVAMTVGLGGTATACSKEEPAAASPASVAQAKTFRFAPPDGIKYVRTDRRKREIALVGAPIRRVDEEELTWNIGIEHQGDQYHVTQDLVHVSDRRDGRIIAEGKPPEGISAELVIDRDGNLLDVRGLDKAAQVLTSMVAPGAQSDAARFIAQGFLSDLVAMRYKMLFGETIGRDAAPGTSWTINNPPGAFIESRTVTVTRLEPCDGATCARLQVEFKLDPKELTEAADELVKSRAGAGGGNAPNITVKNANYSMNGSILTEPSTMLNHGATLNEGGTVTVVDENKQELTVETKGTTELTYSYPSAPSAEHPAGQRRLPVAAAK